jgi:uncharacterized protein involved in exopolysaccharide biosynthesis
VTESVTSSDDLDIPDPAIGETCRALIAQNKKITIRAVAERTGVAHTTYSRDPVRKAQIARAQDLQRLAWTIKTTHRGRAAPHESVALARLRQRLEATEARNQLLIASHRAMLSAVGELGGTRAWLRFFASHPQALETLGEIGALPENVTRLRQDSASPEGDAQ